MEESIRLSTLQRGAREIGMEVRIVLKDKDGKIVFDSHPAKGEKITGDFLAC